MTYKTKGEPDTMLADPWHDDEATSFDVIVEAIVGTVTVSPFGEGDPPHVAAFRLIAEFDARGTFKFPMRDGREMTVTVAWPDDEDR